jgi:GNAT superfamily N-acetyltransferase
MITNLKVRQACTDDIDFVIETIIEAEKSGSEIIPSCNILLFSKEKFKEILREALLKNNPDYDYSLSGYLIAEKDGENIGALGSWLESYDGVNSSLIKSTVLLPHLSKDQMSEISKNSRIVRELSTDRKKETLQLEYAYVLESYRRQGVFTRLIEEQILRYKGKYSPLRIAQATLSKTNIKSFNAYKKLGFEIVEERHSNNPEIFNFFSSDTKVVMELNIKDFQKNTYLHELR